MLRTARRWSLALVGARVQARRPRLICTQAGSAHIHVPPRSASTRVFACYRRTHACGARMSCCAAREVPSRHIHLEPRKWRVSEAFRVLTRFRGASSLRLSASCWLLTVHELGSRLESHGCLHRTRHMHIRSVVRASAHRQSRRGARTAACADGRVTCSQVRAGSIEGACGVEAHALASGTARMATS